MLRRGFFLFTALAFFLLSTTYAFAGEPSLWDLVSNPYHSLQPETARYFNSHYVPISLAFLKNKDATIIAFDKDFSRIQKETISNVLTESVQQFKFTKQELQEFKNIFRHIWAMTKTAQNGYMEAAKREAENVVLGLFAFALYRYKNEKDPEKIQRDLVLVFSNLVTKTISILTPPSPQEKIRIVNSYEALASLLTLKKAKALAHDLYSSEKFKKLYPFSWITKGPGTLVGTAISFPPALMGLAYTFEQIRFIFPEVSIPFMQILVLIAAVIPSVFIGGNLGSQITPPNSLLTKNKRFKTSLVSEALEKRCLSILERALL